MNMLLITFMLKFSLEEVSSYISALKVKRANHSFVFNVTGMTCQGCANKINKLVTDLDGVDSVVADVKLGTVTVFGTEIDSDAISRAIQSVGFTVGEKS